MLGSNVSLAAREIRKNLFRSVLTVLGVVIGVAAVVAIITIGDGAAARITSSFDRLGASTVIVSPGGARRGPPRPGMGSDGRPFTMDDVDAIRALDDVVDVAPTQPVPAYVTTDFLNEPTTVLATTPTFLTINGLTFQGDEGLDAIYDDAYPAVLGQRVAREMFGLMPEGFQRRRERRGPFGPDEQELDPLDPAEVVGKDFDLDGTPFRVSGLLDQAETGAFGFDHNRSILVPLEAAAGGADIEPEIRMMLISVSDVEQMDKARSNIRAVLRTRRGLSGDQRSDFSIRGVDQIVEAIQQTTGTVTTAIGTIAAISLLVGGIGIMNVMLVTVTERTREIGVRIAIGAEPGDVMLQFLVEAAMLTAFGGFVGLAIGLSGGAIASSFLDLPFTVNPLVVAGVMIFSIALGVLFGFLPARRAASINPIDALRHE